MELLVGIAVILIVGFGVGLLSGMLGIGGGTILVPVFKLGFGMAPLACTATSLFTIIPTSLSGAITHIRAKTCVLSLGVVAGLSGAVTSPVGVWLASISPEWGTMVAAAAVVLYSSITMFRKAIRMKPATSQQLTSLQPKTQLQSEAQPPDVSRETSSSANNSTVSGTTVLEGAPARPKMTARQLVIGAGIGLIAGLLSGYVGVGGGFLMVPLFMQLLGTPMKLTSGTSLIAVMILAVPGVISQALLGNVEWLTGIVVACGSIPGAIVGSRLMTRIPERALRFIFGGFLLVAAVVLVLDQMRIL